MSSTVKIYVLQPQLDAPAQSRIRFPLWLKCLHNIAQMELTTLDPLGAFYLVALDADWNLRPQKSTPMALFATALPSLCRHPTPLQPLRAASELTLSHRETLNYNNVLQPTFIQPFAPALAASLSTKSTPSTSSALGPSRPWIWSLNSKQCLVLSPSRRSTPLRRSSLPPGPLLGLPRFLQ